MIYISYPSALDYFLNGTDRNYPQKFNRCSFYPELASPNGDTLGLLQPKIMMPKRRTDGKGRYTVPDIRYPENSYVIVNEDVAVESPEMCFLKAARNLKFHYLVELGNCLCAEYVYDANQVHKQRQCTPITTVAQIRNFIDSAKGFYGAAVAAHAAPFVKNNSGSIFESRMAVSYFTPRYLGGFKMIDGDLNGPPVLTADALKYLEGHQIRCDVIWHQSNVACEYDSTMTHTDDWQRRQDAKRQTALNLSGYKVARFSKDDFKNFEAYERAMMVLWKDLGMKNRETDLRKYIGIRRQVFMDLYWTKHSFFTVT